MSKWGRFYWRSGVALAAFLAGGMTSWAQAPQLAPLNPDFAAWQNSKAATVSSEGHPLGWIPSPASRPNLKQYSPSEDAKSLPTSYDLRTLGDLTPVGNQVVSGPCWAFAAIGALEGSLLHLHDLTFNFSEHHLINHHGFDWGPFAGGNNDLSTAYFLRGTGPINETDDPYTTTIGAPSPNGPLQRYVKNSWELTTRADIKAAIMNYGPVATNMYYDDPYYNAGSYAYYCPTNFTTNHGIALVGWNDSMNISGHIGAWIVKNSWGTSWGASGYFYLAYDDAASLDNVAIFTDIVPPNTYSTIYQYDPLGMVGSMGWGGPTGYAANRFYPTANEEIVAVSFYAKVPNTSYQISVYDTFSGMTFSSLLGTKSGTLTYAGYNSVELTTPIPITAGNDFSVVVRFTCPGDTYPVPMEYPVGGYSSTATASSGQSYISYDGSMYQDMTSSYTNSNVCIKALAKLAGSEGEGEGEGEGETTPCNVMEACPDFNSEGTLLYGSFGWLWSAEDADGIGITDSWEMALLQYVMCQGGSLTRNDAVCTYHANLDALRQEAEYATWQPYEHVLAALMSISSDLRDAILAVPGVNLTGTYAAIGEGSPGGEPFAASGNLDKDAWTNLTEYQNTLLAGLFESDYIYAAMHAALDGSEAASALAPVASTPVIAVTLAMLLGIGIVLTWRKRTRKA